MEEWLQQNIDAQWPFTKLHIMKPFFPGAPQCAGVKWPDEDSAKRCIAVHACTDCAITPGLVEAHWEHHENIYLDLDW